MHTPLHSAQSPLISFIITANNLPENLLKECLESVLSLSLSRQDRQIIVVDDGSDVPAANAFPPAELNEITYIRQANQGLSEARNTGMRMALGRYIQFIDGDDKLLRTPYEHCLDIIRYREADMVLFRLSDKETAETPYTYDGPVSGSAYMHTHNITGSACSYLFRRGILGSLRFTKGIYCEDEEFTPQLLLRSENVFSTNARAYLYRQRGGSITQNKDKEHVAKRLDDTLYIIKTLQDKAETVPKNDRVALQRRVAQLSMDYLHNVILLTHSRKQLHEAIQNLRERGLFPLPDKDYTHKYKAFRKLINTRIGRTILLLSTWK